MTNQDKIRVLLRTFAARPDVLDQTENVLRELQEYGDELVPALTVALNDDNDNEVRLVVMRLLWEMGTDAELALPAMINSLKDRNRTIRIAAAGLAARSGEKAKAAVPILESWIGSDDKFSRVVAIGHILKIDPTSADELLPLLIDALELEGMAQLEAICQLECLGEMATDSVPALKRLLDNADSCVRLAASDAIHAITNDPVDSIKLGLRLLEADDWMDRYVACEHLGFLGAKAQSAVRRLRWAAIDDESEAVRNVAGEAFDKIEFGE